MNRIRYDVSDNSTREKLKRAAEILDYLDKKGIPIKCIDTYLLRMGGENAFDLLGYSDCQIKKMGRWRGAMLEE